MEYIKLGEIAKIVNGFTFKSEQYVASGLRVIRIANVQDGLITDDNPCFYPLEFINKIGEANLKHNDLLMSLTGYVGRVALIDKTLLPAGLNQRVACIRPIQKCTAKFLFYFFQNPRFKEESIKNSSGSAQLNMSTVWLANYSVPLYSLEIQNEIVSLFDEISSVLNKHYYQLNLLEELKKTRFIEMFGDLTTNPNGYLVRRLNEIAEFWNGLTYKPSDVMEDESGVLVLRSSNIQNGELCFDDNVYVGCQIKPKYLVKQNDILMCSRNGSAKLVGKVALINKTAKPLAFGAFMMIVRSKYHPYLKEFFETSWFREQLSTGTSTVNQITGGMLNDVKLPIPPLEEVMAFNKFLDGVSKAKQKILNSINSLVELRSKKLEEFFGGN